VNWRFKPLIRNQLALAGLFQSAPTVALCASSATVGSFAESRAKMRTAETLCDLGSSARTGTYGFVGQVSLVVCPSDCTQELGGKPPSGVTNDP
jgi:hypothetical protein